jgi:hypothetical protein
MLDLWKDAKNCHYIGVCVTFVHDWKLYATCLGIKEFPVGLAHTAVNIKVCYLFRHLCSFVTL